jgi:hypothetical protein
MDIDSILDAEAKPCEFRYHTLPADKQALLIRARERHLAGVDNPTKVRIGEMVGLSEAAVRRFFKYGCNCG